jgi:hypothetical protein
MAYQVMYGHYFGPQHVDNIATMAEDKLKNTFYNGKQRRWDFKKDGQCPQATTVLGVGRLRRTLARGVDPQSKLCYLLEDGIKTDKFNAVQTCILSEE